MAAMPPTFALWKRSGFARQVDVSRATYHQRDGRNVRLHPNRFYKVCNRLCSPQSIQKVPGSNGVVPNGVRKGRERMVLQRSSRHSRFDSAHTAASALRFGGSAHPPSSRQSETRLILSRGFQNRRVRNCPKCCRTALRCESSG